MSPAKKDVKELLEIGNDVKNLIFTKLSELPIEGSKSDLATMYMFFLIKLRNRI